MLTVENLIDGLSDVEKKCYLKAMLKMLTKQLAESLIDELKTSEAEKRYLKILLDEYLTDSRFKEMFKERLVWAIHKKKENQRIVIKILDLLA